MSLRKYLVVFGVSNANGDRIEIAGTTVADSIKMKNKTELRFSTEAFNWPIISKWFVANTCSNAFNSHGIIIRYSLRLEVVNYTEIVLSITFHFLLFFGLFNAIGLSGMVSKIGSIKPSSKGMRHWREGNWREWGVQPTFQALVCHRLKRSFTQPGHCSQRVYLRTMRNGILCTSLNKLK